MINITYIAVVYKIYYGAGGGTPGGSTGGGACGGAPSGVSNLGLGVVSGLGVKSIPAASAAALHAVC